MRKKLRLRMEDLSVASFATVDPGLAPRGTVKAHGTFDFCYPPSASEPMACLCMSDEPTYDTTCNPNQCSCMPTNICFTVPRC